jgi:hypothetical protein
MLNITNPALDRLSQRLADRNVSAETALRFTRRTGGWKLGPDQKRPGDVTFAHDGRDVLLLEEDVALAMADMTLDVGRSEAGLKLRRS